MDLILIEGLPGSGKSTMAEMLCNAAIDREVEPKWYVEQAKDHPIHPHDFKLEKHKESYADACLKKWKRFVAENEDSNQLFIFEGTLFQSTVRFMLEGNHNHLIFDYYKECESVLENVNSKLIYLRSPQTAAHIDWTMNYRGEEWTDKVAGYLEKTPYCSNRRWEGERCMISFWSVYAELCDSLMAQTSMSNHTIKAGRKYFDSQFNEAMSYINYEVWFNKEVHLTLCV